MLRRSLIMVMLGATFIVAAGSATLAFQSAYRLPCMIFYRGAAPITTNCVVNITATGNSWIETVKTENGRKFIIHKDGAERWYLDHELSDKVSDEPNTCYQNRELKLCF
jgi:hypothetical protein